MKRLLLVEDHVVFREALATIFESETDLEPSAQAGSVAECRCRVGKLEGIDVAIVDLSLPDGNGKDLVRELSEAGDGIPVLVLTEARDRDRYAEVLGAGAGEVLTKDVSVDEIIARARRLAEGD